jgi:hypothetical protein
MDIRKYMEYVCDIANDSVKHNPEKNIQVIDAVGEAEINGVKYQVQILLEPNEQCWVDHTKAAVRKKVG